MRLLLVSVPCVLPAAAQQKDPGALYKAFWLEKGMRRCRGGG